MVIGHPRNGPSLSSSRSEHVNVTTEEDVEVICIGTVMEIILIVEMTFPVQGFLFINMIFWKLYIFGGIHVDICFSREQTC